MIKTTGFKTSRLLSRPLEGRRAVNSERFWGRNSSDGYVMGEFAITSYCENRRHFHSTGFTGNPSESTFRKLFQKKF